MQHSAYFEWYYEVFYYGVLKKLYSVGVLLCNTVPMFIFVIYQINKILIRTYYQSLFQV